MIKSKQDRDSFVKQNLGLVHSCAHRFTGKGIEYDDLFSAGCMGLVKATDAFDEDRGVKFSTYAVPVILGEIRRLFRDGGSVKVSRSLKELSMRATKERERFMLKTGREPTVSELADLLEVTPEQAIEALEVSVPPMSLTTDDEEGGGQLDIRVDSPDEQLTDSISIKEVVNSLDEPDRKLILVRYFQYNTQRETAKELGMTQL
ncbi:MAG: sigma-70 family RNA polymerase sigma factor, partial [Massilioclostridium sp.]|nr:sigma-70 family RNA polymerase sigma factor [Massilioclostridium sp.]